MADALEVAEKKAEEGKEEKEADEREGEVS